MLSQAATHPILSCDLKRRSLPAPWTYAAVARLQPEGAAFQCDHVGFGTLLFTL